MAFPTAKNHKKLYHRVTVFLIVFIFSSPTFVIAQTGTSLPQNFAHSIFCTINDLLGIKSCQKSPVLPNPDSLAGVAFIPIEDEPQPQIIQNITHPVIERTIHTREIIKQLLPENDANVKTTENLLAQFSRQLEQLSQNLYQTSSSAFDDTDLWRAIALMNVGGVSAGSSNGSGDQSLVFNSGTSILTISAGNSVDLSALSGSAGSDDQTLSAATYNVSTNELSISIENGNTIAIDLSALIDDADASATNEIQSLLLTGDNLSLSGTSTAIDLSAYLDDTTLTELQVDAFVFDNGYLTSEVDGSVLNEIQDLQLSGDSLVITGNGTATTIDLSPYLNNTDTLSDLNCTSNEIAKWNGSAWGCSVDASGTGGTDDQTIDSFSLSANIISLSLEEDGEAAKTIDLTAYVNTDTQLNEVQVDSFVSDNGYLTSETDGSITNEIQALALSSNILSLSGTSTPIDLSIYLDNTDTQLSETQVDAFVSDNGYLTSETDNQTIDVFSLSSTTLSLSLEGDAEVTKTIDLSFFLDNTDTTYLAGTGLTLSGTTFSSDLGTSIDTTEITNGTIIFADLNNTDITLSDFANDANFLSTVDISSNTNLTISALGLELTGDAIALSAGFNIPPIASTTEWSTAFGWGDHSLQGYITAQSDDQTIDVFSLVGDTLSLSLEGDGEAVKTVNLSSYAKDTDLHDAITLSGAFDYLTLVGQDIVRGAIDLASDITGTLSIGNGGTGATTTALARSNLGLAIGANIQAFDSDTSLIGQTIETTEITNGTILGADLNLTDITLADFTNDQSFITDGNSNWDNSYGFITSANDTVSGSELDGVFSSSGLLTRTGAGTYGTLDDNSANWNTAFGWGDHSGQGYLTGITGQSIKALSDVYGLMTPADGQVLTFNTINGWQAEDAGGGALFTDAGASTYLTSLTDNLGIGTTTPTSLLHLVSAADAAIGLQTNITVSGGGTETFNYTGGEQAWVVPAGVTSITVDARGARGGGGGGNGGRIEVTASTTPGETLYIYVGSTAGYNGGGSGGIGYYNASTGGGASDIRQTSNAIGDRIVVAGGGGAKGAAYTAAGSLGGAGGAGGGFGNGGNGGSATAGHGNPGGSGSSGSGAGVGGGASGSVGAGGAGASAGGNTGGGGGGGSSYPSTGTHTAGYQSSNGQIIITYTSSSTEDVDWVLGTDQSQEGFFKISASTVLGTSDLLTIDTDGNVGIGTNAPTYPLHMASGAHVTAGGSWTNASSRDLKENFVSLNPMEILSSINDLDISQWNYKVEDASILHIGPIAQDFFAELGLGGSDVSISTIDTAGVALIGIQALSHKFDNLFAGFSLTEDGTLMVPNIETDKLKTKTFCVGSTCITEDALRDLLDLEPLSEVSNVLNDPDGNTDFMEEILISDEEESSELTAASTTPLSEEPEPTEQATSTIEKIIQQEIIEEENQTLDENPIDVSIDILSEPAEEIVEQSLSEDQADGTEIFKLQVSEPEPMNQTPLIDNPQAGDNDAALIN